MENKQKILNEAFYGTLFMAVATLLAAFWGIVQLTFFSLVELIVFPVLGFFTKKSSLLAARLLVVIFLIDSVFWIINWFSRASSPVAAYGNLLVRFVFWSIFYRAYLVTKHGKT